MLGKRTKIGKHRIIKKIEESNFAVIYKIRQDQSKTLALKIAKKSSLEHNELISREFQILSQFKHPNIVTVYDYDVDINNRSYFTLEFVQGKPINQYFNSFSQDFILAILQIIDALSIFHNKGFIHSDLKPEHIVYNKEEKKAVLIDFGFAQQRLGEEGIDTKELKLAGTIGYIAPEVLKGIGIDQRSDLYSLGVIISNTVTIDS